jgi:hypothetical protein
MFMRQRDAPLTHLLLLIQIIDNQLILCRIFHLARLFLLPTLRLRLGFAMCYSNKHTENFIANSFYTLLIYDIMNKVTSKKYKLINKK